jgi:hypothetical protein
VTTAPLFEPLNVPITKHLDCGHDRTDGMAAKPGTTVHCNDCRALADVERVSIPPKVRLTNHTRGRLITAGYRPAEVKAMEAEQEVYR